MSHRAMIDGTVYEVTGGKTMVDGTVYSITGGKTLVDGTVYSIDFGSAEVPVSFSGKHTIYGDGRKGWIEITGKGTLTVLRSITADIYLLGKGGTGGNGKNARTNRTGTISAESGYGAGGGKYLEVYGQTLSGTYEASLSAPNSDSSKSTSGDNAKLGEWNSYNGTSASRKTNGTTYNCNVSDLSSADGITLTSGAPANGANGRQPFSGNNPMSQGMAAKKLGAGGGSGGLRKGYIKVTYTYNPNDPNNPTQETKLEQISVICSSGRAGESGSGSNTGAGGSGGDAFVASSKDSNSASLPTYSGNSGSTGIIIVRWGY